MAPAIARPFIRGWTIEIDQDELKVFSEEAYPAVVAMQDLVRDRVVQWHPKPKADAEALNDRSFSDRLLCKSTEAATEKQLQLEPIFFCSRSEAGPDECAVYKSGNQLRIEPSFQRREQLSQWRFEAPGRRMTNSTNDALLAQRTWDKNAPSMEELSYAMAGAMHPTTESHAVGADSAYERLGKILMENLRVPAE